MIDRDTIRGAALKIIGLVESIPPYRSDSPRKDWLAPPKLTAFKRLEPLGFGLPADKWWFAPEECKPELVWPLDVGIIAEHSGADDELCLQRVRSVTAREARGYADRFSPHMVRSDIAQTDRGVLLAAACVMAWMGGRWVDASKRVIWSLGERDKSVPERIHGATARDGMTVNLATSIALRQRYEWAVSLGLDGSPSIRFATDPTGIKEAFKVRDLPEGKDRREALMTWVSDHWRQDRSDPEIEGYVRKHLRGAVSFSWRGMEAEILPAQFDIEQRDGLVTERKEMKVAGLDKRRKAA